MESETALNQLKTAKNPEELNDVLIDLGNNPKIRHLIVLDYILDNFDQEKLSHIKLNLIYFIGELGLLTGIKDRYLLFLENSYYESDRWIRNEIIQALNKISRLTEINRLFGVITRGLFDEYEPIKINSLRCVLEIESLRSNEILAKILLNLRTENREIKDLIGDILKGSLNDESELFDLLNQAERYKGLNKHAFRNLLMVFFDSVVALESFRTKIQISNWQEDSKKQFLNEMKTYERILT